MGTKTNSSSGNKLVLAKSHIVGIISAIEVDPSKELPLHVVIEEREESLLVIKICQSSYSSRVDFNETFHHNGKEIFIYDLAGEADSMKVIFFNQDSPMWRFMLYRQMNELRVFKMEELESWD